MNDIMSNIGYAAYLLCFVICENEELGIFELNDFRACVGLSIKLLLNINDK